MRRLSFMALLLAACAADGDAPLVYCSYAFEGEIDGVTMSGTLIAVGDGEHWAGMMSTSSGDAVPMSGESTSTGVSFSFRVDGDTTLSGSGSLEVPFGSCPDDIGGTMADIAGIGEPGTWEAHTSACAPEVAEACGACLEACACTMPCSGVACDGCTTCIAACHADGACAQACSP